jgi:hypothetical protein
MQGITSFLQGDFSESLPIKSRSLSLLRDFLGKPLAEAFH